ncbi:MAG TPA: choice-of-anchor tandem repeat GloVer-containing protein [Rhizomicrobium sp.]|jgi:uncharacterized repeat protein (TIGR03803 family)|nr:choice-of-anchor tandem repeat GloVer-containing protein [Rhizomicrobium sp.]
MSGIRTIFAAGALAALVLPVPGAQAWTLKTLYSFCSQSSCGDGNEPSTGLLQDQAGDLYGTTEVGGAENDGVVFELANKGGKLEYKVLHQFCFDCGDGTNPSGALIADVNGDLYGTTAQSGPTGCGMVFELIPNAERTKWKEKIIYAASCAPFGNNILTGLTYQGAATGAPYDGASPLYGTTAMGGTGNGTVFEIAPEGNKWRETDLYAFCPGGKSSCTDGNEPGQLIVDASGNLYGNTAFGGSAGAGVAYELIPGAKGANWTENILYNFCSAANCNDGGFPLGALVLDGAGNLYGTATQTSQEGGTVYKLSQQGGTWKETVLCTFFQKHCGNGYFPQAGVILDGAGNLYGTNSTGGKGISGTVFELSGTRVKTLYNFCVKQNCADGGEPIAPLIMDASGNFYGTTIEGGKGNSGTIFELSP